MWRSSPPFIRFSTIIKVPEATGLVKVERRKEVVWIDLDKEETTLFREMSAGHRRAVSRARRLGVTIEHHRADAASLAEFSALYREMILRVGAGERWHFPDSYFEDCALCLGPDHVSLCNAKQSGETIASALILHDNETAYYHLSSGSREGARHLRPNHLLIFELALWAKARGCRRLLLGGGSEPEDGIFRFKAGFSKSRSWLYTSNVVYDQQLYRLLCEARDAWDQERGFKRHRRISFPPIDAKSRCQAADPNSARVPRVQRTSFGGARHAARHDRAHGVPRTETVSPRCLRH